ncbi:MAG: hypothetical protein ACI4DU_01440 [Lachnospiraceae bacterium]
MNPFQMIGAMKNPQAFMQQMMNNSQIMQNPMARNAVEMYQKGDMQGLNEMMNNLCKERGTTPQQVQDVIKKQFGL